MTKRALRLNPGVMRASPVGHPPTRAHACASSGPAARWIAPQTPPPGARLVFAALTMASTSRVMMSATRAVSTVLVVSFAAGNVLHFHDGDNMLGLGPTSGAA